MLNYHLVPGNITLRIVKCGVYDMRGGNGSIDETPNITLPNADPGKREHGRRSELLGSGHRP